MQLNIDHFFSYENHIPIYIIYYLTNFIFILIYIFLYVNNTDKVCDDNFDTNAADAACMALGYESGSWETIDQSAEWSENDIPILMDEVACESSYSDFSECEYKSEDDCTHSENVLLNCHSSEYFCNP